MKAIVQAYCRNVSWAWLGRLARVRTEITGDTPLPLKS